jgi:hypothetical protein
MIKINKEIATLWLAGYRQFDFTRERIQQEGNEILLVIRNEHDYPYNRIHYYATKTFNGEFVTDEKGMVTFESVKPIIDKNTRWKFLGE